MYLVTCTRPDLAHTVSVLSQFCSHPLEVHHLAVKRVFRYLTGTRSHGLVYPSPSCISLSLEGFSDAAYGNCGDTRRSWSGYIFLLNSCLISWRSTKQHSVATSTTEAEYMALSATARQASWYINGIKELGVKIPVTIKCDNTSTIELSHHSIISQRSKHIDIHYHYVRECLMNNKFTLEYIETSANPADLLTKALDKTKHHGFTQQLGCHS